MKAHIMGALCAGLFSLGLVSTANATLFLRGGGFIYNDVLDITWTQNANIRDGEGPSGTGVDTWVNQRDWALGLSIMDTRPGAGGVIYSDWRLPNMDINGDQTIVTCATAPELACRDNELGYLFWQEGITGSAPGLFTNVQSGGGTRYWSGTDFPSNPTAAAMVLGFTSGIQQAILKTDINSDFAWAVRSGDVAAVPAPPAVWLFGSALGLLGWIRRITR